ncbi:NEL-type E3 ubiquitin ligase domain-containing protein [Pseudomonas sp. FP2196]|uniref:NEL-type E3 ubiquitin ligase domain-containing protein n=1 Tax=Pseudomonas sp. FP2196 TaxID=2954086 RepID=UPI002734074F|nr:NEL-type E3 ubiquitin ligase domain-containing protein [Pseudomonas sp. FP2196]WLH36218.1 NEL-type E3 ubiquitin ligase domain-containing protein [Pseudomonas sp. FP2196]
MATKTPMRGTATVDVHTRVTPSGDAQSLSPDTLPRVDFGSHTVTPTRTLSGTGRTAVDADLDAILAAPSVLTREIPAATKSPPTPVQHPLEHYWITANTRLPDAGAQGLRLFKGRHYADVPEGGTVQVGIDPQTGLYRARLQSELTPSGPVLVRDPDSNLWHERNDLESVIFPLSDSRLEAFRTNLDFANAEPDSDGLVRHDGKLYVVIHDQTYQALRDLDASSPQVPVMRIVRAEDPVARDDGNVYVGTRPGRSETVVLDPRDGWVGVNTAGPGGMRRGDQESPVRQNLIDRFIAFVNRPKRPESRVRKLFPSFKDPQVATYLQSLGDDITGALTRKEAEYKILKSDLLKWTDANPHLSDPSQQGAGNDWAKSVAKAIRRCWRHETDAQLRLPLAGAALPALSADFSHVRLLELDSVAWSASAETFLSGFAGLRNLTITRAGIEKLPAAIGEMHSLTALNLRSNKLKLDAASAGKLSALVHLETIALSENPLGTLPDFAGMPKLKELNVSNTGIEQWPAGLNGLTALDVVDLSNNKLREVPPDFLNPPDDQLEVIARINRHTLVDGNPFPVGYWMKFDQFWQRVGQNRPELAAGALPGAFQLGADVPEIATVQRLYPNKDVAAAKKYLMEMGDDMETVLASRVAEFDRLETQLEAYQSSVDKVLSRREHSLAREAATAIKKCWLDKEQTTLVVDLGDSPMQRNKKRPLPALTADFSHVRNLTLGRVEWSATADTFLANFPELQSLTIQHSTIAKLPDRVGSMNKLTKISLSSNDIELDQQSAARLASQSQLKIVDLSHNPLKITPDFSGMSELSSLDLSHTGITQWPSGLEGKTALTGLNLSHNQLKEVPQSFIEPAPELLASVARINGVTLLEGNDFPSGYWRKFDGYWRRLNREHPELMSAAHPAAFDSDGSRAQRYRQLFPAKSIKECRDYIWGLEKGTASTRLAHLEEEFSVLKSQLDAWVFSGGGNRGGYVRAHQFVVNAANRDDRTAASNRIISCWRRETPQRLANDGTPIGLELSLSGLILPSLPDIDVDFSHVGSLTLSNMSLSTSPEGFLTRFRHVRWLDISHNQLRELPPAIGEMSGLTRLYLQNNQISLTADTARVVSERTTLRALLLHENPQLRISPDFSRITDIRSINLANTGIDTFPTGLSDQPLLDTINLSGNRISQLPESVVAPLDERLLDSVRVNNVTNIRGNPLSLESLALLDSYNARLVAAGTALTGRLNLIDTARGHVPTVTRAAANDPMARWTVGLSADEVSAKAIQWQILRDQQGSDGLFNTLERLLQDPAGHSELQRRVWKLIDSITENTPESEALRRELFDRAGDAACCDRAAFTFANLETRTMMHNALAQARDQAQGPQLSALSKALFRLHEVDKIASADIAQREARIVEARRAQGAEATAPHVSEEVEIRLFYRHGLKDRLQLPGQPERMGFGHLVKVTKAQLDAAYEKVIALDNSPEEFEALVSREFWQEFVTHKYQSQFEAQRQPFQIRQVELDSAHAARVLPFDDYDAQSKSLQASVAIEEAALIETLSRQELREYAARHTGDEAAGGND